MKRNETPESQRAITERLLALDHARFIEPEESWESNKRRYQDSGRYVYPTNPDGTAILGSSPEWVVTPADPTLPIEYSASYGDWDELRGGTANLEPDNIDPAKVYVLCEYAGGSDYSGDLVEKSNHKALIEMMPEGYEDGVQYIDYCGGHGTFALAIRFDAVTGELLEALEGLEDYPILDEDLHSQMESDAQSEAWESDYRGEFKTVLGRALFQEWVDSPATDQTETESDDDFEARQNAVEEFLQDECGEMSNETLDSLFYLMSELSNTYWENETGGSMYIDIDRVVSSGLRESRKASGNDAVFEWRAKTFGEVAGLIQAGMSSKKYDLGIMRYHDPNQLALPFGPVTA